jgi:hypothetical protein
VLWSICIRVARWFLFEPKISIWVNFGRSCNRRCWYVLWPFGIFYRHLGYFMTILYTLCLFGTFFLVWVYCVDKDLATLVNISISVNKVTMMKRRILMASFKIHSKNILDLRILKLRGANSLSIKKISQRC